MNKNTNTNVIIYKSKISLLWTAIKELFTKKDFILVSIDKKLRPDKTYGVRVEVTNTPCVYVEDIENILNYSAKAYIGKAGTEYKMDSVLKSANEILEKWDTRESYASPAHKQ